MISKLLSWGRSNHIIAILFLSFISFNAFSMDYLYKVYSNWQYINEKKDSDILPWNELLPPPPPLTQTTPEVVTCDDTINDYALVPEMTEEQKKKYIARGKTWQELMEVFEDAPEDMQDIVDHLIKSMDPEWRAAFIVGPPGTGKTTAALAVPHRARWYWKFLSGPELAGQYRNEAKERLAGELRNIIRQKKKVVVIIDELNRLLENFNSKGYDTDITASFLWTFLDEQKRNENFFFIGTMNRDDKVPDPVKHRLGGSTIFFPAIEDPQKLLSIFKKVMGRNPDIAFDSKCDDLFFQSCFKSLESEGILLTPRDYENIRFQVSRLTHRDDRFSTVRKIKQHHVIKAIHEVAKTYTRSGLGREQLNDEEWRDFNAVQSRIIEVKLQCCHKIPMGASINPLNLVSPMGIFKEAISSLKVNVDRSPGLNLDEAQKVIEQEFSENQIALYRRVMKLKSEDNIFMRRTSSMNN